MAQASMQSLLACPLGGLIFLSIVTAGIEFPAAELSAAQGQVALVTGAAGFIGSHVAKHCRDLGMSVVAVDDLSGGFISNVPEGVTFVKGDIKDPSLIEHLFTDHKIDFVYHLAAYAAEGLSHFIRSFNYRTNLVGSVEILNQAIKHKVKCFVFTSSIAVYGSINDLSQLQNANRTLTSSGHKPKGDARGLIEEDIPSPEDPYGISKYAFELDLQAAHELYGMDFVIFRPHNVYGPHQNMFDKYRNVVGIFINQIFHGQPMTVFGDGEQVRAFSYVEDVSPVISRGPLVPEARNQVFNVGADTPYTVNQLVNAVAAAMGKVDHPIDKQPARLEVVTAVSNHDKVRRSFGPAKALPLEEGLERTVAWYQKTGKLFRPVEFAKVEIKENMPPSWVRADLEEASYVDGSRVHAGAHEASGPPSVVSTEDYLRDEEVAFWLTCFREGFTPGAVLSVRRHYPTAPLLAVVDRGGDVDTLRKLCTKQACTAVESDFWMGKVHEVDKEIHNNYSCRGLFSRFGSVLDFAPKANWIIMLEPDNRMLRPIRRPREGDVLQLGNILNRFPDDAWRDLGMATGFPNGYSTAGGTLFKRAALRQLLQQDPRRCTGKAHAAHNGARCAHKIAQDICIFVAAGYAQLVVAGSQELLQATESCDSSTGILYSCYRCIHDCKLREGCCVRSACHTLRDTLPLFLARLASSFLYFISPGQRLGGNCFVGQAPCRCESAEAVRRTTACIAGCAYTCPAMLHNTKGEGTLGAFVDCAVEEATETRGMVNPEV